MEETINMSQKLFLEAMKASLKNEKVVWEQLVSPEDWKELFDLAEQHQILPMIFEAVYSCPAARRVEGPLFPVMKRRVMQLVMIQTMKTSEFLGLYRHLKQSGVDPVLVKGLVCRELYPNPDYRLSGDEDVLISPAQFAACHEAMTSWGMVTRLSAEEMETAYEIPYTKEGSPLYIELHKHLFPPESEAYGELNSYFTQVHENTIQLLLQGMDVTAMDHTSHFFYLICHAFKHFLHSGFGLRQVSDIALYANIYGRELDWQRVYNHCVDIRADRFLAALLKIAEKYLTFSPEAACYPAWWRGIPVDEGAMLADLLCSGIYGASTMSRKHSSNMTLEAVASQKQGSKSKGSIRVSLFPPARKLEGKYPYLKKYPALLPVAWCSRIFKYGRETAGASSNNAVDAMKIGKDRIALLRAYRIIE